MTIRKRVDRLEYREAAEPSYRHACLATHRAGERPEIPQSYDASEDMLIVLVGVKPEVSHVA